MTDKEIAMKLTEAYLDHLNHQMDNKHTHTDLDKSGVLNAYRSFYNAVASVDSGK